jgi:hypothetical protein
MLYIGYEIILARIVAGVKGLLDESDKKAA